MMDQNITNKNKNVSIFLKKRKKSYGLMFKIFLVLVKILRKSMHQFSYIMMDFKRRIREGDTGKNWKFFKV